MNSSKILFVGKYAKSPKKSPRKQARTSKSKYEDISLGTIMRTSKSRSTNFNKPVYEKRPTLDKVRKINLNDKTSVISRDTSTNNYASNTFHNSSVMSRDITTNNYTNKNNPIQSKIKKSMISVKKITKESQLSSKKKHAPNKSINNVTKTHKNKLAVVSEKTIQTIQKTGNVRKSKNTRNKSSSKPTSKYTSKPTSKSTSKSTSKPTSKKRGSPNKEKIIIANPTRRISVYVNPDLYSKINSFFYPHLFINSRHNFKFFSNFDIHDKYLASVISDGVMITKYS